MTVTVLIRKCLIQPTAKFYQYTAKFYQSTAKFYQWTGKFTSALLEFISGLVKFSSGLVKISSAPVKFSSALVKIYQWTGTGDFDPLRTPYLECTRLCSRDLQSRLRSTGTGPGPGFFFFNNRYFYWRRQWDSNLLDRGTQLVRSQTRYWAIRAPHNQILAAAPVGFEP